MSTEKLVATLRARLALVGVVLSEIEDDGGAPAWVVTESHLTRSFGDLRELAHWTDLRAGRLTDAIADPQGNVVRTVRTGSDVQDTSLMIMMGGEHQPAANDPTFDPFGGRAA